MATQEESEEDDEENDDEKQEDNEQQEEEGFAQVLEERKVNRLPSGGSGRGRDGGRPLLSHPSLVAVRHRVRRRICCPSSGGSACRR